MATLTKFELSFRVDCLPVAQPRPRVTMAHRYAHAYTPSKHPVHDFKEAVKAACTNAYSGGVHDMPFALRCDFLFPRPSNRKWKRRSMPTEYKRTKPDLDNLVKPVKDCLTGIVWNDDSQIVILNCAKLIVAATVIEGQYRSEPPGCEIQIRGIET